MKKSVVLLLLPLCIATSCSGEKLLKQYYENYFTVGTAINDGCFDNELLNHFNSITDENDMKWIHLHPDLETYSFDNADRYINLAKEKGMGVRGHTLVWHNEEAIPADVFKSNDKDTVLGIERDHIDHVVRHFKDDVYCWDVVNEVIEDGNDPLKEDGSNIYRKSKWYNICGRDFIKEAYIKADAVLKDMGIRDKVKLFYNDYENAKQAKYDKTVAMLKWLQSEDVPIDGVGLQCHYHLGSFDPVALDKAIKGYSELGLDVHITEFDCEIYDRNLSNLEDYATYADVPQQALDMQAAIYDRAFEIFRKYKDKISNVTFWGLSDENTYMNDNKDFGYRHNYPYIFGPSHELKPAYYMITSFKEAN